MVTVTKWGGNMVIPTIGGLDCCNPKTKKTSVESTRSSSTPSFGKIAEWERAFLKKYMTPEDMLSLNQAMMDLGPKLVENSKSASALRDGTMRVKIKEIKARNLAKQMENISNFIGNLFSITPKKDKHHSKLPLLAEVAMINPVKKN